MYLCASPKPVWELLEPGEPRDLATAFRTQFAGMTATPITVEQLLETRRQLLSLLPTLMDNAACDFLLSLEHETPDFELIGLPQAAALPGVRRKLQNMAQRSAAKREANYRQLVETLERLAGNGRR